ncbi:sialate O-acetylesterase isoform X2 [Melanotaenia boesemani]|uniref:sialate O-acetylesterase isoform X2 n=1 Tax=Melanotaenia boesemani TaxID=1250792 RepID=UPI001C04B752|nr:sialate O-acetylesterase isoform X2 [Melanotaenia boesemani]
MSVICAAIIFASLRCCDGNLRFASYYGDHMVLQKSPQRAVLWGYGTDGAQVTVSLSGPVPQKTSSAPMTEGIWQVTLDPVVAGGPYNVTAASQNSTVILTDVLFGDIWLCGGQSNMYFKTSQVFNASEELANATKYPHLRTFMAALKMSDTELTDLIQVKLPWSGPTSSVVAEFSAVCWLFGRYMYDYLRYPIGLVESCWGGTPVEAWSSSGALQKCGLKQSEDSPKERNSVLWNAMIHPLLNMTIYGAIWYQGEANADYHQDKYNCSFPAMIDDWRKAFHQGSQEQTAHDFPFGFIQLDTYRINSTDDGFPDIRWHQTADVGFVPNPVMKKTFMAVTFDLPDKTSPYGTIHPRDKQDVAYRLTLGARAVAYDEEDVLFLGPFPKLIWSTETVINITYDQVVSVTPSKDIFEICCSVKRPNESKSQWAPAAIVNWDPTSIQLSATYCQPPDEVTAVRYAWRDWPCDFKACPVYSASRILPAPPFIVNKDPGEGNIWKSSN